MSLVEKVGALLAGSRVQILFADEHHVQARVRGDHGIYDTEWRRDGGWSCSCLAYGDCSHRLAVAAVIMHSVGRVQNHHTKLSGRKAS